MNFMQFLLLGSLDVEISPHSSTARRKKSGAVKERAGLTRAEGVRNRKNLLYNSSGLETALQFQAAAHVRLPFLPLTFLSPVNGALNSTILI